MAEKPIYQHITLSAKKDTGNVSHTNATQNLIFCQKNAQKSGDSSEIIRGDPSQIIVERRSTGVQKVSTHPL